MCGAKKLLNHQQFGHVSNRFLIGKLPKVKNLDILVIFRIFSFGFAKAKHSKSDKSSFSVIFRTVCKPGKLITGLELLRKNMRGEKGGGGGGRGGVFGEKYITCIMFGKAFAEIHSLKKTKIFRVFS